MAKKKSSTRPSYDTSTGAGQKRLMQESIGLEYVTPRRIADAPGDYGADPLGLDEGGVFRWRMVPSGDIVDKAEHDRRLGAKRHHATKKSPAQLQREIDEVLAKPGAYSYEEAMAALEKKHAGVKRGGSLRSGHAPVTPKMSASPKQKRYYVAHPDEVAEVTIVFRGLGDYNVKRRYKKPVRVRNTSDGDEFFVEETELFRDPVAAGIRSAELAKSL